MYWIPEAMDLKLDTTEGILHWSSWLSQGSDVPHDKALLLSQLSSLLIFDFDPEQLGPVLGRERAGVGGWQDAVLYGQCVWLSGGLRRSSALLELSESAQKFSRSFVAVGRARQAAPRERSADRRTKVVGLLLSSELSLDALLSRRDGALKYVNGLIREFGEAKVLVFP